MTPEALCDHCNEHVSFEVYLQHQGLERIETKTAHVRDLTSERSTSNPFTQARMRDISHVSEDKHAVESLNPTVHRSLTSHIDKLEEAISRGDLNEARTHVAALKQWWTARAPTSESPEANPTGPQAASSTNGAGGGWKSTYIYDEYQPTGSPPVWLAKAEENARAAAYWESIA